MSTEKRILDAAAELMERDGADAVTTRAVCDAAGVTAPTLYHHFGDKEGLRRALVARGIAEFVTLKRANRQTQDPLVDLRRGWNAWIAFAFERPNLFRLMIESTRKDPSSIQETFVILRATLGRLHADGRLGTDVETAFRAIWAASNGVLSLFMQGESQKHIKITSDLLFEAVTARILKS